MMPSSIHHLISTSPSPPPFLSAANVQSPKLTPVNNNSPLKSSRAITKQPPISPSDSRLSLIFALANQAATVSQRLPNIETVKFKVLRRNKNYEIRQVEAYFIAETTMPGKYGFEFAGASQSFNVLAEYLFGKNTGDKQMEMTTPVFTRKTETKGKRMEMTTPVLTTKDTDQGTWKMSFVMPSKYGPDLPLPKNSSVTIREVPEKIIAVVAFSGFVTDEEVERRESALRELLKNDSQFCVKENASLEVAQYNPPFTLPFSRRNEISLEVEWRQT